MWSRVPLLRLLIPFVCGLLIPAYSHLHISAALLFILAIPVFAGGMFYRHIFGFRSRWVYGLFIIIFMIVSGCYFAGKTVEWKERQISIINSEEHLYLIKLEEAFILRERSCRARAEVLASYDSASCSMLEAGLMLYIETDSSLPNLPPGSFMLIQAQIQLVRPPANPEEFDYRSYLARKGIFHSTYLRKKQWKLLDTLPEQSLMNIAQGFRMKLIDKLKAGGIDGKYFGISSALLLGEDSNLDADVRDVYARAGAMHILCVSGLHVGVIFLIISALLRPLKRLKPGRAMLPLILMGCVWSYALLTGLAPPVGRASCMISFFIIGNVLGRHKNVYNTLAASALLMMMLDPEVIFGAGFQLSYSAVLGIISLQKPLENLLYFRYKLPARIWSITSVSIAAQIGTLPVVLYYFHQFPLYSLITNLIVIPMSSVIIYSGILLLILPTSSIAGIFIARTFKLLLHIMDSGVNMVERIPYGLAEGIFVDLPMAIMISLMIFFFSVFLMNRRKWFLLTGLLILLSFSLYRLNAAYSVQKQEHFIVYSVRGHSAYDCIRGSQHHFYADSLLLASHGKISYSISPSWLVKGLEDPIVDTISKQMINAKCDMLIGTRFRILSCQGHFPHCHPPREKQKSDYLVLSGKCPFDLEDVFKWFSPGLVIIDSSVPPWVKATKGDQRFWDVRQQGAFVSSEYKVRSLGFQGLMEN